MEDVTQAARTIAGFLQSFTTNSGLRLRYQVKLRGIKAKNAVETPAPEADTAQGAASEGPRSLYVEFSGPDTHMLTNHNGEVLNALEHIATKILRLEPEEHELVSFDADRFKANRDREMRSLAAAAVDRVHATGRPHAFPAMTSRERRMLHLILSESGLPTASSGEGSGRFVVLYPEGTDVSAPIELEPQARRPDPNRVRDSFRHR